MNGELLIHGIDTLQCAYFLERRKDALLDFQMLATQKEILRQGKSKSPAAIELAGEGFLLQPYGSSSGYPYILENSDFKIECGEFNSPNFFVTFRSQALWRESAWLLHERFQKWARTAGFTPARKESLSRVDYCFDYHLPLIDFSADNFVSRSTKDSQYRENGRIQTFCMGKGDIVLRVYDKVAEIKQQSEKVWFYKLWGRDTEVWRIEWQVRKPILRRFEILTFEDLADQQGDLLYYLASEHDSLRVPTPDSNSSRWPLHPLWADLIQKIENLPNLGVSRVIGMPSALEERMERMAISVYGYMKRVAAIGCIQKHREMMHPDDAMNKLLPYLRKLHDPLAWQLDVSRRIKEMECGQW